MNTSAGIARLTADGKKIVRLYRRIEALATQRSNEINPALKLLACARINARA